MRQIVLDTETTGLDPKQGHKIIEIGCVELINRKLTGNNYHVYINPGREIEQEAIDVHGITNEFLIDKPTFSTIAEEFIAYISGAELIIHNAPFDVGFMDHEFASLSKNRIVTSTICGIKDTLVMAREMRPGQKNNLDALCKYFQVDNGHRTLHGALLDAEILAEVYLMMTGGQTALNLASGNEGDTQAQRNATRVVQSAEGLKVIMATADELVLHEKCLSKIDKKSGSALWLQ